MPKCQCGADLPGRRRKCDDCKKRPGKEAAAAEQVDQAPAEPEAPKPPPYPAGLRTRGRTLWDGIGQHLDTPAGQLALEACRLADRLDELDETIAGTGVLRLLMFRTQLDLVEILDGEDIRRVEIKVEIGSVLETARKQQLAFRQMLDTLAELKVKSAKQPEQPGTGAPTTPTPSGPDRPSTPLDELEQRRRQRGEA